MRFAAAIFLDRFYPILFDAFFELLSLIFLINLSLWGSIQHYTLSGHLIWIYVHEFLSESILSFVPTNVTPQKRDGRKFCVEVFSQGLEEMHQDLSKDGEYHKLGDVKAPHWTKHSRFAHVYFLFFYQRITIA